jgi:hypothetical protein
MLSGIEVLGLALVIFFAIWLFVIWGSRYFGPTDH